MVVRKAGTDFSKSPIDSHGELDSSAANHERGQEEALISPRQAIDRLLLPLREWLD